MKQYEHWNEDLKSAKNIEEMALTIRMMLCDITSYCTEKINGKCFIADKHDCNKCLAKYLKKEYKNASDR